MFLVNACFDVISDPQLADAPDPRRRSSASTWSSTHPGGDLSGCGGRGLSGPGGALAPDRTVQLARPDPHPSGESLSSLPRSRSSRASGSCCLGGSPVIAIGSATCCSTFPSRDGRRGAVLVRGLSGGVRDRDLRRDHRVRRGPQHGSAPRPPGAEGLVGELGVVEDEIARAGQGASCTASTGLPRQISRSPRAGGCGSSPSTSSCSRVAPDTDSAEGLNLMMPFTSHRPLRPGVLLRRDPHPERVRARRGVPARPLTGIKKRVPGLILDHPDGRPDGQRVSLRTVVTTCRRRTSSRGTTSR